MYNLVIKLDKKKLAIAFTYGLFLFGMTWALAPWANHALKRGPNLISEYEAVGMPYAVWFRFFDFATAATFLVAVYIRRHSINARFNKYVLATLYVVCGLLSIDTITPVKCIVNDKVCRPILNTTTYIHGIESYMLGIIVFGLSVYVAVKYRRQIWLPIMIVLSSVTGIFLHGSSDVWSYGLQVLSTLLWLYALWFVSVGDMFDKQSFRKPKNITKIVATLVASVALSTLVFSGTHFARHSEIEGPLFSENTAWLTQNMMLISITLLYLVRSLWLGSKTAWRIVVVLVCLEFINYATINLHVFRMILYLALFVTLLVFKEAFRLESSTKRFILRLRQSLSIILITVAAVSIVAGIFSVHSQKQWNVSAFTPNRVIVRTFLLEVSADKDDPIKARLLAQALTSVGVLMYSWIFLGLFLPGLLPYEPNDEDDRQRMARLLAQYSNSSEDNFKLWPVDKTYWFSHDNTHAVAYRQSGKYTFALAGPVGPDQGRVEVIKQFNAFCESHGTNACWLLVSEDQKDTYEDSHLQVVLIGASAKVDIAKFATLTVKGKWWRWVRNKAQRQGLKYKQLSPPHSQQVINELSAVSSEWLENNNHKERGFALGYFNNDYMQSSVLHVLTDESDTIVAFANQVPTYAGLRQTTIDLMRYKPEIEGAIAFLLSELIINLYETKEYSSFDLGFVPLANMSGKSATGSALKTVKKILSPIFSAHGLEQFKNKFEPEWQNNYIAYSGDYVSLPRVLLRLQDALDVKYKSP